MAAAGVSREDGLTFDQLFTRKNNSTLFTVFRYNATIGRWQRMRNVKKHGIIAYPDIEQTGNPPRFVTFNDGTLIINNTDNIITEFSDTDDVPPNNTYLIVEQSIAPQPGGRRTRRKKITRKRKNKTTKNTKVKRIVSIFKQYPKIFPRGYFRYLESSIKDRIQKKEIIFKNGVVLTWNKYRKTVKKTSKCIFKPGDIKIKQLVNKNEGNGAAKKIFLEFLKKHQKCTLWLEVRKNNTRAIKFYKKNGFKKACDTKFGSIQGIIMMKNKS